MIPGFDFAHFAATTGPWIVAGVLAAIIFAESGLLIGFFLPGDTILFTAGFLVSAGTFQFNIHLLVAIVFLAAVLGDGVGYLFGKRIGRKIFTRPDSLIFRQENVRKAEAFYKKYGGITIVLARFTPVVRTFAPIVAGVGNMHYRTFLGFNVIGALLWAVGITYLGYYIGSFLHSLGINIDAVILPIILVILTLSVLPPIIHVLKDKKQRQAIWNGTKRQANLLFRKR